MSFQIALHCDDEVAKAMFPERSFFEQCCKAALLKQNKATEVSLALVTAKHMTELNHRYRNQNKATNVLSFQPEIPHDLPLANYLLGDIVFCPDVITKEANEQHKALSAHWAHMIIHGMLHLQGYDHLYDHEAAVMENLEVQLLAELNYPDPYRSIQKNDA